LAAPWSGSAIAAGSTDKESTATTVNPRFATLTAIADSIQVRFQGINDLTGTYRLNEDETISIPGVGRISIAGMTASDLEKALASRILGATGRASPVSVEVTSYRHVFVGGYVERPGSFQWKRGMNVVKAISLSGGIYREPESSSQSELTRDGALEIARLELAQALVDRARLTAELNDRKMIETPERLIGVIGARQTNELVEAEQTVLTNRRAARDTRLKNLEDQKAAVGAEIEKFRQLATSLQARITKYGQLLEKMRASYRRGRLSNQRLFEVEAELANLEEKRASTNVQIVKAETSRQILESKQLEMTVERREKIIESLTQLATKIKTEQIRYDVARERSARSMRTLQSADTSGQPPELTYQIVRQSGEGELRMAANHFDLLMPGDTLLVTPVDAEHGSLNRTKTARGAAGNATR
jgi:protein involved in polysaccharide export with SLBB domain